MDFLDFLLQKGVLTDKDIAEVKKAVSEDKQNLELALQDRGLDDLTILNHKGEFYGYPVSSVQAKSIGYDTLKIIPEESAAHYQMVPLDMKDGLLEVGMVDPTSIEAKDALSFITAKEGLSYKIFVIAEVTFDEMLKTYSGLTGQVKDALDDLTPEINMDETLLKNSPKDSKQMAQNETQIIEDAPVTKIVATVLRYAVEGGASDVHIEPLREQVRVRFRVDGILNTSLILPRNVQEAVVARIKILSRMKLDEKRKPQDGRFSAKIDGRKIDFRVSTFPVYYGEKVVMRILDQEKGVKPIDEIGLSPRYLEMLKKAISRPYGLILVSGPTGSGKSTTLYSLLNAVDRETKNVLSLEDPVEYSLDGVSQSQVRSEIGYTFANGLRTTLRQDPDIIMVGEIRDAETAGLAIQAALTGHLVLSTIHTNTSTGIVPRLIDMGIDPYLITPTLILGIGQRLVRKICPDTGREMPIEGAIKKKIEENFQGLPQEFHSEIPKAESVLKAIPSDACPRGTQGREAVFEMFEMDRDVEKVILNNPVETAIFDAVREKGLVTMREHAIIKLWNTRFLLRKSIVSSVIYFYYNFLIL